MMKQILKDYKLCRKCDLPKTNEEFKNNRRVCYECYKKYMREKQRQKNQN